MCTQNNTIVAIDEQMPQVFMQNIAFNDGSVLPLTCNSIVVFTGANNSGKSQVLRDVENCLNKSKEDMTVVIKNSVCDFRGKISNESFFNNYFS